MSFTISNKRLSYQFLLNKLIIKLDFQMSIKIDQVWLCLLFNIKYDDITYRNWNGKT